MRVTGAKLLTQLAFDSARTPVGQVLVVVEGESLVALDFEDTSERMHRLLAQRIGPVELKRRRNPAGVSERVRRYFAGELRAFDSAAIAAYGTPFQERAWQALRAIVPGTVLTYATQATRLGSPHGARAVGRANALNPIAIAIPCHRLIGADQSLAGYAGGLARKRWLLRHEGVDVDSL